jgi:hypothetical protein
LSSVHCSLIAQRHVAELHKEQREKAQAEKTRREEVKKRREENRKAAQIVQPITNPKKLKALSKKKNARIVQIPDKK